MFTFFYYAPYTCDKGILKFWYLKHILKFLEKKNYIKIFLVFFWVWLIASYDLNVFIIKRLIMAPKKKKSFCKIVLI
jgi:hypothetical protein